jgi:hypothetical protein
MSTHPTASLFPCAESSDSAVAGDSLLRRLELDQTVRQTEKAERAEKASQSRRAPKPGGAVQRKRSLERKPRKTRPVHRGRHDHPITSPIITATHIGTAHSNMSTNVSAIEGRLRNSTTSKNGSSIFPANQRENKARSTRTIDERERERRRQRAWEGLGD